MNEMTLPGISIESIAAKIWQINENDIFTRTRDWTTIEARYACMYFTVKFMKRTMKFTGKKYGFDHTTVIHAIKQVENWRSFNKGFKCLFENFMRQSLQLYKLE